MLWQDGMEHQHTAAIEGQEQSLGSEKMGSTQGFLDGATN